MNLRNILPHKAGTSVKVNGTVYQINGQGVAHDVAQDDAAKLLKGAGWQIYREAVPTLPLKPKVDTEQSEASEEGWSEPTEDLDLDYLREMAEAYGVRTSGRMKAATIVSKIKEARGL